MTKENLSLRKKSAKDTAAVESYGFNRVNNWTKNEFLQVHKNSKIAICTLLQNGDYLVGTRKVEKISDICWKVDEYEFTDKRSAIFYCSMLHLGKTGLAQELYKIDLHVGQLDLDKSRFRVRLDDAHMSKDSFKIDLYSSRYEETKGKLSIVSQELEKIIAAAKYINSRYY